jgi:glycosyltransferase involved in cell wall biosynthesis
VTVVIPCYNYGHFLPAAVASALTQESVDVDVIIVDDASTDGSAHVARRLAATDPRVEVVAHDVNRGHIATYNDGVAQVTGEYVVLLSADDLLASGALGRATALMSHHPSVGFVYGLPEAFTDDPPASQQFLQWWTIWSGKEWLRVSSWRGRNFILSPEVVMRTSVMREFGGYNSALPHSGDLECWLKAASRHDVGRVNGPFHAFYREHTANMHHTDFSTMVVDLEHRRRAFDSLADPEVLSCFPAGRELRARAYRALAREAGVLAMRMTREGATPEEVLPLIHFARTVSPNWPNSRRARVLTRRSVEWRPRSLGDRAKTAGTRGLERVRWKVWATVGVS